MVILMTPTKLSVKVNSLNAAENDFLENYEVPDCLERRYDPKNLKHLDFSGKPEHLYELLLVLCYKFDVELV